MSEAELQRKIIGILKLAGFLVFRMNAGAVKVRNGWVHLCPDGTPDLLAVANDGRVIWIEVKTPTGKFKPAQLPMIEDLQRRRQEVHVVRSVGDCRKLL